ncbi:MAG TPA: DUF4864 domain-containing protein [Chthonomonadaceae bacterium]|nr:DUF4864 domain-containing protein [Chthonomonadaceae bacterium]
MKIDKSIGVPAIAPDRPGARMKGYGRMPRSTPQSRRDRAVRLAACAALIGSAAVPAGARTGGDADLDQYRNKNRLLILCAPSPDDGRFAQEAARIRGAADGLKERDVLRFELFETGVSRRDGAELKPRTADLLRRKLHAAKGRFMLLLIDKNGRSIAASGRPMARAELFAAIDATPLRRYEARVRKKHAPAAPAPGPRGPMPSKSLTPEQVVKIQMEALQHNDAPEKDAGIAKTFDFASPQNKQATGPLDHFAQIVKSAAYLPMLNCKSVTYDPIEIMAGRAAQRVHVVAADGSRITYVFELSLQTEGEFEGCWMNDGCIREESEPDLHRFDA